VSEERRALRELARLYGVQESYRNVHGSRVRAGVDGTVAVLRAMGAPGGGGRRPPPPPPTAGGSGGASAPRTPRHASFRGCCIW
jgi:hypothetical protein